MNIAAHHDTTTDPQAVTALWCAVLIQAIADAVEPKGDARVPATRLRAIAWFSPRDFIEVCYRAGVEPDFVRLVMRDRLDAAFCEASEALDAGRNGPNTRSLGRGGLRGGGLALSLSRKFRGEA